MDISTGIIFGIVAMICWGAADFFTAKAVRKTSLLKTFIYSQMTCAILLFVIFQLFFELPVLSYTTITIVLITGFLGVISYLAFYRGLQVGKVSIISPIAACWGAVTVILCLIFLNETLSGFQAAGVCLAILGAVLASFKLRDLVKLKLGNLSRGVKYAVIAALAWGTYFVYIDVLAAELSWFLPMLFIKTTATAYILAYSAATGKDISFPRNTAFFIIMIGLLEAVGFLAYGVGITSEYTVIVAPIGAAFPVITIILARIFLKETLELNQKIGIISVLCGLVLLSM